MIRFSFRIHLDGRAKLLLIGLLLVLLLSGPALDQHPISSARASPSLHVNPHTNGRHYYLYDVAIQSIYAPVACSNGYHMASLWEIMDVSNMTYDYFHPNADTQDDSGYGPPSFVRGWVRTGYGSAASGSPGTANCNNWSSNASAHSGTLAFLTNVWTAPGTIHTWQSSTSTCNSIYKVWCVGDFYVLNLPIVKQ